MTKLNEEAFFCVFPDKSGCSKYLCIFWYLVPMSCEMKEEYFLKLDFQQEKLFEAVRDTTFLKQFVCCESFFVLSMQFNLDKCTGV